jgi:hypothetical protein
MVNILLFTLLVSFSVPIFADKSVRGHTRKNGTVVQPHSRSNGNRTQNDNYSTKGNSNPYTGKSGTKTPKR